MISAVSFCRLTSFALRFASGVDSAPTLVCTLATPLFMLEMLPLIPESAELKPETDEPTPAMLVFTPAMLVFIVLARAVLLVSNERMFVFTNPIEVLSVATFPFIAMIVVLRATRVAWTVPKLV